MANGEILTNNGKKIIINRSYKATPDYNEMNQFKVGADNSTPLVSDTDLDRPIPITGMETVDDCEATTGWTASGTNSVTLNTSRFKRGAGALNLVKSDGSSADVSMSKTTTSLDFTSKDLWFWVYLDTTTVFDEAATTDCLTARFGSSSGDYFQYTRDKADLAAGWNYITFNSTTADSETGTVVLASCDYTFVQFTTDDAADTFVADKLVFDQFELASSDDYFKAIVATYPVIDETNNEVEIQSLLLTGDSVGFNIDGFALWNNDSTELMGTESTITDESKSINDEFVFVEVHRIE